MIRLDKWLWAARFFKTRTQASSAIEGGKVLLNGSPSKPARDVHLGDRIDIRKDEERWEIVVEGLSEQRGPAPVARQLYAESEESVTRRENARANRKYVADPAQDIRGRPTKRDRRALGRLG